METELTVKKLLDAYKDLVESERISFIPRADTKILTLVNKLIEIFNSAEDQLETYNKQNPIDKKSLSDYIPTHTVHDKAAKLWENLCSYALNKIDSGAKGNSILFKFLEEATRFEDLLYGLETYYRDHTLHSLWVYLIGEYLMTHQLENLQGRNFNWYICNDIKHDEQKFDYPKSFVTFSENNMQNKIIDKVECNKDAIWCIIALCHDLGYSLEKLTLLNDRVFKILEYFTISNQKNAGYILDVEHQYLITQFLELVSMDVRIVPSDEYLMFYADREERKNSLQIKGLNDKLSEKEKVELDLIISDKLTLGDEKRLEELILVKSYRDDSTYWRLCQSLEKKNHGILSAYLLYKLIGIFSESSVIGNGEEWGLSEDEAKENLIAGNILFAISQHTFDFAFLNTLNSLPDLLIFADEIEEFSRFGREMQSRKYYDTTADVTIKFDPIDTKLRQKIRFEIIYNVAEHLDKPSYYKFFVRKVENLCKKYSLSESVEDKRHNPYNIPTFCKIGNIKLTIKSKKGFKELYFQISDKKDKIEGFLPKNEELGGKKDSIYKLECIDDKIYVKAPYRNIRYSLKEWLNIDKLNIDNK